ncbi:MAG TPA: SxtJ family membrane protein [Candidatus Omnitrophota bacterium]|nr:SxtJ family membrane protein [Candidatus Omnitrophota bacterium]
MVLSEIKKIDSSRKKLREFGFLVGGVLVALGILFWWRGRIFYPYFFIPGIVLVMAGAFLPSALMPFQKIWMSAAVLLGWVMTRLILSVLFFLVVTPMSMILRLIGKDILDQKLEPSQESYWKSCSQATGSPSDYERQF